MSVAVKAEIEDPRVWNNIYQACIPAAEENNQNSLTSAEIIEYCKCSADEITDHFTVKELLRLEADIYSLSEEEQMQVAMLNKKMQNSYVECMSQIFR